jgi:hypothetical protein
VQNLGTLSSYFLNAESSEPELVSFSAWINYKQYMWWAHLFASLLTFIAGYRLWKIHAPDSVRFAVIALWVNYLLAPLGDYAAAYFALDDGPLRVAGANLAQNYITSFPAPIIWTAYLNLSRRVKNTYYSQSITK